MKAFEVYTGSDGVVTRAYYRELAQLGPIGLVALNLFRAQKCSTRAKVYRGGIRGRGSFRSMAYERKTWSMEQLVEILQKHANELHISWGWKIDPAVPFGLRSSWVLYVDLPQQGQVSFHSPTRFSGPDYPGDWDHQRASEVRILQFCDSVQNEMSILDKSGPGFFQNEV